MSTITFSIAIKELQLFIDKSGVDLDFELSEIKSEKREKGDSDTENLAVVKKVIKLQMKGLITINEEGKLTYKLRYPLTKGAKLDSLTYKCRMNVGEQKDKLDHYKVDDHDGRMMAVTAARTEQHNGIIKSLDQIDYDNIAYVTSLFV